MKIKILIIFISTSIGTWEDFKGIPIIFTGWGAAISSNIYLDYDSINDQYTAYAAMNNYQSWRKMSFEGSEYTLNHEQYHFNLTESVARLMNRQLQNDTLSAVHVNLLLIKERHNLNELQDRYDSESDHGLNVGMQKYWEFKIDSMLIVNSGESGYVNDYISEASLFLPEAANSIKGTQGDYAYKAFYQERYGMGFMLIAWNFEYDFFDLKRRYEEDSLEVISIDDYESDYVFDKVAVVYDSTSREYMHDRWIIDDDFAYQVRCIFPDGNSMEGYINISNATLSSFKIMPSSQYWAEKVSTSSKHFKLSKITSRKSFKKADISNSCAVINSPGTRFGLVGKPFLMGQGVVLPYEVTHVADSLIDEVTFMTQDLRIAQAADSYEKYVLLPLPATDIFNLNMGYQLKSDTSEVCFQYYTHNFSIDIRQLEGSN